MKQLRHCRMCGRTVLPADLSNHPRCVSCTILLEPEFNEKTLCRCGKYHNAVSLKDSRFCRRCLGEEIPTGTPTGEPERIEEAGEFDDEYID